MIPILSNTDHSNIHNDTHPIFTLLDITYTQVHGFFSEPKLPSGSFYDPYDL